ncbi:hypothetical protein LCGC14_2200510 [marine sediment metagenome]|uniref:Uncharacterized protein n=1 Tax=marine sediment metagenome TaxID=412755 RepID=A0A0F9E422_9ZZZZ
MAQKEIEVIFKWENSVSFEVTIKEDANPVLVLIKMEENGDITNLWPAAKDLVERYIRSLMAQVGKEMKAP